LQQLTIPKIENLENYLCIGNFGLPPLKYSLNKDEYIQAMKHFRIGNTRYTQEDGYHIIDTFSHEIIEKGREDWQVEYKLNSEIFRCDQFTRSHNGLHILFSGCSVTEGIGIKQEDVWAYKLYKKISEEREVSGYFNLAHAGNGYHQIIGNFLEYINKYGKPDIFVVLHPNTERYYRFLKDEESFKYEVEAQRVDDHSRPTTPEDYLTSFGAWAKVWDNFTSLCKVLNVELIWGTWDDIDQTNIKNLSLFKKSFVPLQNFNDTSELSEKLADFELNDKSIYARDTHPGPVSHYIWSTDFYNAIKDRGLI
jgi:hypothetical protein